MIYLTVFRYYRLRIGRVDGSAPPAFFAGLFGVVQLSSNHDSLRITQASPKTSITKTSITRDNG
jgi:hypothetical protein